MQKMWPAEYMIVIVLQVIILRQTHQVAVLDFEQVSRGSSSYAHHLYSLIMQKIEKKHLAYLFGALALTQFAGFVKSRVLNWRLTAKAKAKLKARNKDYAEVPEIDKDTLALVLALNVGQLCEEIRCGRLTSVQVVTAYVLRARSLGRELGLVAEECYRTALDEARQCDLEMAQGKSRGFLHGVPISIKDHYGMKGYTSSCGLAWKLNYPDKEDSVLVQLLIEQGAIPFVRSNVCQGMMWIESSNQIYGVCQNPWDKTRTTGGSSGGEGGLIAARASPLGIGSDIGGSIRVPASFCGVYGFKATPKRVSTRGAYSSSLKNVECFESAIKCSYGPIGRCVDDLVLVMKAWLCERQSQLDPTVVPLSFDDSVLTSNKRLKIGYFTHIEGFPVADCIQKAVQKCADSLTDCEVVSYSFPNPVKLIFSFLDIYGSNCKNDFDEMLRGEDPENYYKLSVFSANHQYLAKAVLGLLKRFGNERLGNFFDFNEGIKAEEFLEKFRVIQDLLHEVVKDWERNGIDAVICPAFGLVAPQHGLSVDVAPSLCYSFIMNVLGLPAGVVPAGLVKPGEDFYTDEKNDLLTHACNKVMIGSQGLPYSVQVVSLPYKDELVLKVMKKLENILQFHSFPI